MQRLAWILVLGLACGDDSSDPDAGSDGGADASDAGADASDAGDDDAAADDAGTDAFDAGPMPRARSMYVAVQGDDRLAVVELGADGSMTAMSDLDVDLGAGPGTIAYGRSTRRLFVGAGNQVITLALDDDGVPSIEGRTSDTGNPVYLALTADETRLVSAYFGADELKLHDVSGAPPHAELDVVSTNDEPHAALIGPGDQIYVPHRTGGVTQWYAIEDDALELVGALDASDGVGPRHIIFSPDQMLAWLINEFDDSVTSLAVDASGALTANDTVSSLPDGVDGSSNTCADVHVTPDGAYVYGSNRGHDSIAMFSVGAAGALTLMGTAETEARPREFDVSPDGRFVVVAGQDSGFLQSYAVEDDGRLTSVERLEVGPGLRWVIID